MLKDWTIKKPEKKKVGKCQTVEEKLQRSPLQSSKSRGIKSLESWNMNCQMFNELESWRVEGSTNQKVEKSRSWRTEIKRSPG
jgi:hypothetical protein